MNYDFLVDSHCHLDLLEQKGENIDQIINNAVESNVKFLQTICTKVSEFDKIYVYTRKYPNVYASLGLHPNNVDQHEKVTAEQIIKLCDENPKLIGIGETGLDYYYDYAKKENQIISFIEHIKAARITGLPLIIHSRDADLDMIEILKQEMQKGKFKALLHCFSSSKELALEALKLDIYISISGIVTFKNALELQEIVKILPLDKILVETDSPYLAPNPFRGKTNQPSYTKNVAEFVADLRKISFQEVTFATSNNFFTLFDKAKFSFEN
jgi:TatD DNase family protein